MTTVKHAWAIKRMGLEPFFLTLWWCGDGEGPRSPIALFRTRAEARAVMAKITSLRSLRAVKVRVTVEEASDG